MERRLFVTSPVPYEKHCQVGRCRGLLAPLVSSNNLKIREFDITIRRKVNLFKNQLLTNLDHDFCGFINF
jgi:hypothetical protein